MKKKISLFANGWNSENLDNFIMGLRDAFDNDADIFVFSSAASFSQSPSLMDAENSILCAKIRALILTGAKPVYIRFNQPIVASLA